MKKGLLFMFFGLTSLIVNAQTISLTDNELISYYQNNYPTCINGSQLDLNCFAASQGNSLNACVITEIDDLAATANSSTQITLTWSAGLNDDTKFDLQRSTSSNFSTDLETFTSTASAQTYTDNSVQAGTQYFYRIRTVYTPLSGVANVSAQAGNNKATVSFSENGALSYTVKVYSNGNDTGLSSTGQTSPIEVSGLTAGTEYSFTVTPENQCGLGVESEQTVTITPFDLDNGLIAHYPFNGNANDESSNTNDGNVVGASLTTDRFGNANSAYSFDGTGNTYITVPHSNDLLLGDSFTVVAWAYRTANTGQFLVNKGRDISGGSFSLSGYGTFGGTVAYGVSSSTGNSATNSPPTGSWHQFVGVMENGVNVKIYIDGELISENPDSGNYFTASNTTDMTFGIHYYPGVPNVWKYPFSGKIDDIRIYNRVLSDSEIKALLSE